LYCILTSPNRPVFLKEFDAEPNRVENRQSSFASHVFLLRLVATGQRFLQKQKKQLFHDQVDFFWNSVKNRQRESDENTPTQKHVDLRSTAKMNQQIKS